MGFNHHKITIYSGDDIASIAEYGMPPILGLFGSATQIRY